MILSNILTETKKYVFSYSNNEESKNKDSKKTTG